MKKLIALFATTAVASGSAMGAVALSGTASVSYDDNGSGAASETSYDADLAEPLSSYDTEAVPLSATAPIAEPEATAVVANRAINFFILFSV